MKPLLMLTLLTFSQFAFSAEIPCNDVAKKFATALAKSEEFPFSTQSQIKYEGADDEFHFLITISGKWDPKDNVKKETHFCLELENDSAIGCTFIALQNVKADCR